MTFPPLFLRYFRARFASLLFFGALVVGHSAPAGPALCFANRRIACCAMFDTSFLILPNQKSLPRADHLQLTDIRFGFALINDKYIYPSIAVLRRYAPYCRIGSCFIFSSINRFSSSVTLLMLLLIIRGEKVVLLHMCVRYCVFINCS